VVVVVVVVAISGCHRHSINTSVMVTSAEYSFDVDIIYCSFPCIPYGMTPNPSASLPDLVFITFAPPSSSFLPSFLPSFLSI